MEEKKLRNIKWFVAGLLIVAIIIGGIYVLGSRNMAKTAVFSNDPETGIKMWIDAANQKDINRLYDLAPDEIKQQMTLARFEEANLNSSILQPGSSIASYDVIDKKQNGTFAQINARVFLLPPGAQGNLSQEIPVSDHFDLFYEHGEWKIWTDSETGIQRWIDAINVRDIDRVYDLAPDEIKKQIPLAQFKKENINNTFLQPGNSFVNFTPIEKKQNATSAQIIAQVFLHMPTNKLAQGSDIAIFYKFALYYEHGEWKIWTLDYT